MIAASCHWLNAGKKSQQSIHVNAVTSYPTLYCFVQGEFLNDPERRVSEVSLENECVALCVNVFSHPGDSSLYAGDQEQFISMD